MTPPKPTLDDLRIERKPKPDSQPRIWRAALIIFALAAVVGLGWRVSRPGAPKVRTVLARESAGPGAQRTVLNASGYVTARRAATVSSKVTGKVVEVLIEEGMKVQE